MAGSRVSGFELMIRRRARTAGVLKSGCGVDSGERLAQGFNGGVDLGQVVAGAAHTMMLSL
jgi:hypothetical protein